MTFYGADLAHIHDAAFGHVARAGAATLLARLERAGIADGLIVDLGCGTGISAQLLSGAGFDVLGVDVSSDALAIARSRAPQAVFVQGSLHEAEIPPCVAVAAIGEAVNYGAEPGALAPLFARVRAALRPRGLFLLDVAGPGLEPQPRRVRHEGDGWVLCFEAAERAGLVHRRIVVLRDGRRSEERHVLRLFGREEVLAELAAAGLRARALAGYGRAVRFRPGHAGFVASLRA